MKSTHHPLTFSYQPQAASTTNPQARLQLGTHLPAYSYKPTTPTQASHDKQHYTLPENVPRNILCVPVRVVQQVARDRSQGSVEAPWLRINGAAMPLHEDADHLH